MKFKQLLRFYFCCDGLEKALNNIILRRALDCNDYLRGGGYGAEKICTVIEEKQKLGTLWNYLDSVLKTLTKEDIKILKFYAEMRTGIAHLNDGQKRAVRRTVVKFLRRARNVNRYSEGMDVLKKYYCLLG